MDKRSGSDLYKGQTLSKKSHSGRRKTYVINGDGFRVKCELNKSTVKVLCTFDLGDRSARLDLRSGGTFMRIKSNRSVEETVKSVIVGGTVGYGELGELDSVSDFSGRVWQILRYDYTDLIE